MIAIRHDIDIEQGATFLMTLHFQNADGTPVDLNGYAGQMQVRQRVGGRVLASVSEGAGITTTSAEGKVEVRIPATVTAGMSIASPDTQGVYDLFVKNSATGDSLRLAEGFVTVIPAVTR
jgi:hypothetical protein